MTLEYECEYDFGIPKAGQVAPTVADITLTEKNGQDVGVCETAAFPVQWQGKLPWASWGTARPNSSEGALTFTAGSMYQCTIQIRSTTVHLDEYTKDTLSVSVNGERWTFGGGTNTVSTTGYIGVITSPPVTAVNAANKCGYGSSDEVYWHYYDSSAADQAHKNLLYICGRGEMESYSSGWGDNLTNAPWAQYAQELKTVVVSSGVTRIGSSAFAGGTAAGSFFSNLTQVRLPDELERINSNAFTHCRALGSVDLPKALKTLGNEAFLGCSALGSIDIPSSVTDFGDEAFAECSSLSALTLALGLTVLGEEAFRDCTSLTSVTIPTSLDNIEGGAFDGCSSLTSITVPNTTTSIGRTSFGNLQRSVFEGCQNLVISGEANSVAHMYAVAYGIEFYPTGVIGAPGGDISGPSPSSVQWMFNVSTGALGITGTGLMKDFDFSNPNRAPWHDFAKAIKSIHISEGITSIGAYAFRDCGETLSISAPSSVSAIGEQAMGYCESVKTFAVPNGVTDIPDGAFYSCSGLESISLPASVTTIGKNAFLGCSKLASITIPAGVTQIGVWAFCDCTALESVELPAGISTLETNVFNGSGLKSIVIPDGVTSIANYAFMGCDNLAQITIPASVGSIGEQAFSQCSALTSVELPAGLATLEAGVFEMSGLASIVIPKSVTHIADNAFLSCVNLEDVRIEGQDTTFGIHVLHAYDHETGDYNPLPKMVIYAPAGSKTRERLVGMGLESHLFEAVLAAAKAEAIDQLKAEYDVTKYSGDEKAAVEKALADAVAAITAAGDIAGVKAAKAAAASTLAAIKTDAQKVVVKQANPMKAKAKKATVKAKKLKKKAQTLKASKLFKVTGAAGKVTYKLGKISCKKKLAKQAKKKIKLAKSGKLTLKKGLKKGTYKLKVTVKAAGDATHSAASKTVTVKLVVK